MNNTGLLVLLGLAVLGGLRYARVLLSKEEGERFAGDKLGYRS